MILLSAIPRCAVYRKCGPGGCPGDAEITAGVRELLGQYPTLASNAVDVHTWDHVVYLYGLVNTDMERQLAEAVAGRATGATGVVYLLGVHGGSK